MRAHWKRILLSVVSLVFVVSCALPPWERRLDRGKDAPWTFDRCRWILHSAQGRRVHFPLLFVEWAGVSALLAGVLVWTWTPCRKNAGATNDDRAPAPALARAPKDPASSSTAHQASYAAAVQGYLREHDRWYQWALFFLGSIGSIFLVQSSLDGHFPIALACAVAFVLSCIWVQVSLNLRASMRSWTTTLWTLEDNEVAGSLPTTFAVFDHKVRHWSQWRDLRETLRFWSHDTRTSVSRILVLFGITAAMFFLAVTVALIWPVS